MLYNNFKLFLENELNKDFYIDKFVKSLSQYAIIDIILKAVDCLNYKKDLYNDLKIKSIIESDINQFLDLIYELRKECKIFITKESIHIDPLLADVFQLIIHFFEILSSSLSQDQIKIIINFYEKFDAKFHTNFLALIEEMKLTIQEFECITNFIYQYFVNYINDYKNDAIIFLYKKLNYRNTISEFAKMDNSKISSLLLSYFFRNLKKYSKIYNDYIIMKTALISDLNYVENEIMINLNINIHVKNIINQCCGLDNNVDWRPSESVPEDYYAL